MWPIIFTAIMLIKPEMSHELALNYAAMIDSQAIVSGVDPLLIVAIAMHESGWNERAISKDGEDYGLLQVRARYYGGRKEWLLNPATNIKAGGYVIAKSIEFCRRWLKREPTTQEWLSVYQGSRPSCKSTQLTKSFEDYAVCVGLEVERGKTTNECEFH